MHIYPVWSESPKISPRSLPTLNYGISCNQIGWVKTDSKAIQAIHDHVITQNSRVWVSNNDQSTWNLHIKNVQEEDRGEYMCQVNTDPMKSQVRYLNWLFKMFNF